MDVIRENLPNIIYGQSYMTINNKIFIFRQSDKSFRFEYDDQNEYYEKPIDVLKDLAKYDIEKVKIFFPTLKEVVHIYG
jgi:hypothetical protein